MILKRNFHCPVICREVPKSISQTILPDNLEGVKLEFCQKSHLPGAAAGDCPSSLLIVPPRPLAPVNTLAMKVFWPPCSCCYTAKGESGWNQIVAPEVASFDWSNPTPAFFIPTGTSASFRLSSAREGSSRES